MYFAGVNRKQRIQRKKQWQKVALTDNEISPTIMKMLQKVVANLIR